MKLTQSLRLVSNGLAGTETPPHFVTRHGSPLSGRVGEFRLTGNRLRTPHLFPVFNMFTGPATHGLKQTGGIFKFLKRAVLLEQGYDCYLTEVLHFTDFKLSPAALNAWLPADGSKTLHDWMLEWFQEERMPPRRQAVFCDSGGFRLLFNSEIDLDNFGIEATPADILNLQLRYGADIAASLDYPLPPNTPPREERQRSRKSLKNAVEMLTLLDGAATKNAPFPYLAVHGQTPSAIRQYIRQLFRAVDAGGSRRPFGLAIGSLVPRRSNYEVIVALVHAAMQEVQENESFDPRSIPIHVFGITGDMIPVMAYLGVDTFDSSSHVQSARALGYYDPRDWKPLEFKKLADLPCDCPACTEMKRQGLPRLQEIISAQAFVKHLNRRTGEELLKSQIYAWIAGHNLSLQVDEVRKTQEAIYSGDLIEHVVRFGSARDRTRKLLAYLADIDERVAARLRHLPSSFYPATSQTVSESEIGSYSLTFKSTDFSLETVSYRPGKNKTALLLVPCSSEKPYSTSKSHRLIKRVLTESMGAAELRRVEKVTISGLYGPVPERFEKTPAIASYDYVLNSSAHTQIRLITERLIQFLQKYGSGFPLIVGYATTKAYRKVMADAFSATGRGILLPRMRGGRSLSGTDFGRAENLNQLEEMLKKPAVLSDR